MSDRRLRRWAPLPLPICVHPCPSVVKPRVASSHQRSSASSAVKILGLLVFTTAFAAAQTHYPPAAGQGAWEQRSPAAVGLDPAAVEAAVAFAIAHESTAPRDQAVGQAQTFGLEPFGEGVGPFSVRGDPSGVILRHGYLVAEWGDTGAVEMTHSVSKSILSTVVGIAHDRGLIPDVDEPVGVRVPTEHFADGLNARITWDHLLRQTSDWEGTLWDKPDWGDRPPRDVPIGVYRARQHAEPGTTWKYNDTRVNLLAYAAMRVWHRPLPNVAREFLFDRIGATDTWRWEGYTTSWTDLDGRSDRPYRGRIAGGVGGTQESDRNREARFVGSAGHHAASV